MCRCDQKMLYLFRYQIIENIECNIIRPLIELAVPVWSPFQKGDIKKLERVQHRVTRLIVTQKN